MKWLIYKLGMFVNLTFLLNNVGTTICGNLDQCIQRSVHVTDSGNQILNALILGTTYKQELYILVRAVFSVVVNGLK